MTEIEKTFQELQKPTMTLIGAFYEMSSDVQSLFADMMAIYEDKPTDENALFLTNKIMGREPAESKKKWIKEQAERLSLVVRASAKKKYIENQNPVPKGAPTSGMLLVGLDIVSKAEKDMLMEAQAAARLISHVDVLHDYQSKTSYKNPDGSFEKDFLDKPFVTRIQRLEHIVDAVVNDIYTKKASVDQMEDANKNRVEEVKKECLQNVFLQKAKSEAVGTLKKVASFMNEKNTVAAQKIDNLCGLWNGFEEKQTLLGMSDFKELVSYLEQQEYPSADLVQHRSNQIINMDQTKKFVMHGKSR
jgi:hypothetical protein